MYIASATHKTLYFTVVELNCNSLENIHGCTVAFCGQPYCTGALSQFHWKSFTATNQSAKTTELSHLENFAIYGSYSTTWEANITQAKIILDYMQSRMQNLAITSYRKIYTL